MEFRSTNSIGGGMHLQGDLVTNVSSNGSPAPSSHGVQLSGGSTGGVVSAAGDEASIALTIQSKGAGPLNFGHASSQGTINIRSTGAVNVGTASTNVTVGSTLVVIGATNAQVQVAGSTVPWSGFIRFGSSFATPNFNTTNAMVFETTHAITGVSTAILSSVSSPYYVLANPVNVSTDCSLVGALIDSSNAGVHCRWVKVSTLTVAASSAHVNFLIVRM